MIKKEYSLGPIVVPTIIIMVLLILAFVVPFLTALIAWPWSEQPFQILDLNNEISSIIFTFIFAVVSTAISIYIGLFLAIKIGSAQSKLTHLLLSMLLLPILMGSTAWAFLLNNLPFNVSWVAGGDRKIVLFWMILAQVWQLSSLATYMFWLKLTGTSAEYRDFAAGGSLNSAEYVLHVVWPHVRGLVVILSLFFLLLSVNDLAKSTILFHGSKGLDTQVIGSLIYSTWREHKVYSDLAHAYVLIKTLPIWLGTLAVGFIFVPIMLFTSRSLIRLVAWFSDALKLNNVLFGAVRAPFVWLLISIIILVFDSPLVLPLIEVFLSDNSLSKYEGLLSDLAEPFVYTVLATIFIAVIAIFISSWLRWACENKLADINAYSRVLLTIFLSVYAISPAAVGICAYWWFSLFHSITGITLIGLFWWLGITLTIIPIMLMFLTYVHFEVKRDEISYLVGNNVKYESSFKNVFWKRLAPAYALAFLFSFSFVWNDTAVTQVVSSHIEPGGYTLFTKATAKTVDVIYGYQLIIPLLLFSCVASTGVGLYAWKKHAF